MTGQHRADRFGSMDLGAEQQWRLAEGKPPVRPLAPFPPQAAGPGELPSLTTAPGPAPEIAHEGDRAAGQPVPGRPERLEEAWPTLGDLAADQALEHVRATFDLLRRMYL